jgi:hypothetical protein
MVLGEFSFAICTTESWGHYAKVEEPTVEICTGKRTILIGMNKFVRYIDEMEV